MWKNKTDRVCRFCKETFCCAKCRDHHVNRIHPGLNVDCCLCASELLPIRYGEFEKLNLRDEELLNHIADKHLPLRCQLCGDLYESKEDFKSFGKCKWWSQYSLTSPIGLEQKLKQCFMTDCNNGVYTPPEIYRKTSTPMLVGQKATFETPCVPHFSLKTPQTNSPTSINIQKSQSDFYSVTEFFSFSHISNEDDATPFRTTSKDEQLSKSNSGRKLNIMEERDETEKITADEAVDMDLTKPEDCILELPTSDVICEESSDQTPDVVKKVRFSDQRETMPECKGSMNKSCVKIMLNTSEEKFHDAREILSTPNMKNTEDTNDVKVKNDVKDTMKIMEDIKNTKDSQMESLKKYSFVKSLQNFSIDSQIVQKETKNTEKENRNPEINDRNSSLATCRVQDTNRVLITMLMESNSGGLSRDLMPLIDSGLKKLQELASTNQPSLVESTDAVNLRNKSITRMEMSISSVESYSAKDATTDSQQIVPSSSLSMRNVRNNISNNGFFTVVAQAMKYAIKSFSGLGISTSKTTEVIQQREIGEESTSTSQESSVSVASSSIQLRPSKRARENTKVSSRVDSITNLDVQSPLAKRQKGWYTMIKGRQPISRMRNRTRNNHATTSSSAVQVFSQGSLTVGDTVLPLPARAHQSTQTE